MATMRFLFLLLVFGFSSFVYGEKIQSKYFDITVPAEWRMQLEDAKGQFGGGYPIKFPNTHPLPWLIMEFCVNHADVALGSKVRCEVACPTDVKNPFDYLEKDHRDGILHPTTLINRGEEIVFFTAIEDPNMSSLLMLSCSPKGIATLFLHTDEKYSDAILKYQKVFDSFRWK